MGLKKVKMLTSVAAVDYSLQYGELVDCDNDTADAWVDAGIAEYVGGDEDEPKDKGKKSTNKRASDSGGSKKTS